MRNTRDIVFQALDNALANDYDEFLAQDPEKIAVDLVMYETNLSDHQARSLVGYVKDWQTNQTNLDKDVPVTTDETPSQIIGRIHGHLLSVLSMSEQDLREVRIIDVVDGLGDLARSFNLRTFTDLLDGAVSDLRRNKGKD